MDLLYCQSNICVIFHEFRRGGRPPAAAQQHFGREETPKTKRSLQAAAELPLQCFGETPRMGLHLSCLCVNTSKCSKKQYFFSLINLNGLLTLQIECDEGRSEMVLYTLCSGSCWSSPVWFCLCSPPLENMKRVLRMLSTFW